MGKNHGRFPLLQAQSALCRLKHGKVHEHPQPIHLEHDIFPKAVKPWCSGLSPRRISPIGVLVVSESHVAGA